MKIVFFVFCLCRRAVGKQPDGFFYRFAEFGKTLQIHLLKPSNKGELNL